jgi:hypothetical protein
MKPVLTIDEAMLLVAMPPSGRVGVSPIAYLQAQTNRPTQEIRQSAVRLAGLGLVRFGSTPLVFWLTTKGFVRQCELRRLAEIVEGVRSGARCERFLADADVRPGPSRAMYPASVLQGRGG